MGGAIRRLANQLPGAGEASQAAPPSSTVAVYQGASISRIRWWPLGVAVSEARHLFLFFFAVSATFKYGCVRGTCVTPKFRP